MHEKLFKRGFKGTKGRYIWKGKVASIRFFFLSGRQNDKLIKTPSTKNIKRSVFSLNKFQLIFSSKSGFGEMKNTDNWWVDLEFRVQTGNKYKNKLQKPKWRYLEKMVLVEQS